MVIPGEKGEIIGSTLTGNEIKARSGAKKALGWFDK